jgi:hypothetical protein
MPLQTQGFTPTVQPIAPQIPGNIGVVKPPLDAQEILALAQQHLSALQIQQQRAAQNSQIAMEGQRLSMADEAQRSALAGQAQQRALVAAQGSREAQMFEPALTSARTAAQRGIYALPSEQAQSQLEAAKANRESALIGQEDEKSDYSRAPDGNGYILTKTLVRNGVPVSSTKSRVALPPGYTPQMAVSKPSTLLLSNGAKMNVLYSPLTGFSDIYRNPLPHEVLLGAKQVEDSAASIVTSNSSPSVAPEITPPVNRPQVGVGITPEEMARIKTQAAANTAGAVGDVKNDTKKDNEFPNARQNEQGRDLSLKTELQQINDAITFIEQNPNMSVGYGSNWKIAGSPASRLHALLSPIQGANFFNSVNSLKNSQGQTGIGRIMQSEVPYLTSQQGTLDQSLDASTLVRSLKNIADRAQSIREQSRESFNAHYANQIAKTTGGGQGGANNAPEQTAENPQTGEKLVLRNGQWVPIQ